MNKISMSDHYIKEKEKSSLNIFFKELTMIENNHAYLSYSYGESKHMLELSKDLIQKSFVYAGV